MAFNLNIEKRETINKCIRFPKKLIKEIEKVSRQNNITFSRFVIEACKYALNDMEKTSHKKVKN